MEADQKNNSGSDRRELIADVRERVLFLRELGVTALDVDLADRGKEVEPRPKGQASIESVDEIISNFRPEIPKPPVPRAPGQSRLAELPSLSKRESAIPLPSRKEQTEQITTAVEKAAIENREVLFETSHAFPEPSETIEQIRAEIGADCTRCKLCSLGRSRVVNSVGNFNADLMFVGEAPGADEDAQGEPFVGRAGQLLTKIIEGIGLRREDVFIGNINRCRPPGNRAPEADESVVCKPFLLREIAVVRPKVIVVLGATAAQNLLDTKVPIGKLRGHFHDYLGVKVMPTFHPAYLLRDPNKKREVWEDMKMVRDHLRT
jgi:DNA polymerase